MPTKSAAEQMYDFMVDGICYDILTPQDYDFISYTDQVCGVKYYTDYYVNGNFYKGSIIIPSTVQWEGVTYEVKTIEYGAFRYCTELTEIEIPNSVKVIGGRAFYETNISAINIPESVEIIDEWCFEDCSQLTEIHLTQNLTSIKSSALSGSAWWEQQEDGLIYLDNVLLGYKGESLDLDNLEVKDGTYIIADYAFSYCNFDKINLPKSMKYIGESTFYDASFASINLENTQVVTIGGYAFQSNDELTTVKFPSTLKSIGKQAFYNNTNLKSVFMNDGLFEIGEECFWYCTNLSIFNIPETVMHIGKDAFRYTYWLTEAKKTEDVIYKDDCLLYYTGINDPTHTLIVKEGTRVLIDNEPGSNDIEVLLLPNTLKTIGEEAFIGGKFTSLDIPESVEYIGAEAFESCLNLVSVQLPPNITEINDRTFCYCDALREITIPNSVTVIGKQAFTGCKVLENVTIGARVGYIGAEAFSISKLATINAYPITPPMCEWNVFKNVDKSTCKLNVPKGYLYEYATAPIWEDFLLINANLEVISGVDNIENDCYHAKVIAKDGSIQILDEDEAFMVFNVSGQCIYAGRNKTVVVPCTGIYLVRLADRVEKIYVKK